MIEAGFRVAARADVHVPVVPAEEMAGDRADERKQKTKYQTDGVNNHRTSLSCSAG